MTIAPGSRLGPYEITAKLGEGGMGEVWRATDSRLQREVAIKVLPAAFTGDKERLARFEREAKLLAQLHHPHIASIFGLEEGDRTTGSGVLALVMELVDGPTLADRLARGALPLEESLAIARQIAEALEAAHEKGIVHRDLKPQNIKANLEGQVKVLDFGLAKAADSIFTPADTHSPTRTAGTELGVILGTAAYMAPEQARGATVDKRADIWAFGVVLYEMLAGRSLFAGPTLSDTLAGVLKSEIDWSALPPSTPTSIRRLLRRCLERNLKNRLHDIADARIALDEELDGTQDEQPRAVAPTPTRSGRLPGIVAAIATLALGAGAGWVLRRPEPAPLGAGARWALAIPDGLTLSTRALPHLALSEDGRLQVAVVEDAARISHLLLRSIDAFAPSLVADTEGAATPFFSPDGNWIGFIRNQSLMKIPSAGGPPVEVATLPSDITARGATWSRDGFIYYSAGVGSGLSRVSENGGPVTDATTLTDARDERTHRWPQALPDGSAVLFTCDTLSSSEFYDDARIEALRPATGERRVLVEGASQARYGPAGRLVFARGGSLFSIAFDPRTLTVRGTPELVAQGVATDVASGAVQFALSSSGAALWAPGGLSGQYHLSWVDRDGAETPVAIPQVPYAEQQLSPDGSRAALVGGAGGVADLWVADLQRGALTRLTMGENVGSPVWSPDGTRVVYRIRGKGPDQRRWKLVWKPADGSRDEEVLLESEHFLIASGFTPDGGKLIYSTERAVSSDTDVYLLPLAGARVPELLLGGPGRKTGAAVSPDGRFVAYASSEGGQPTVFVRPFPAGDGRWQISTPTGVEPRWSRDRSELLYRAGASLYRVPIELRNGFSAGKPELLVDRVAAAGAMYTYNPAPDGDRIFTSRSPEGRGALRTLYLDLGFARRLEAPPRANAGQP